MIVITKASYKRMLEKSKNLLKYLFPCRRKALKTSFPTREWGQGRLDFYG
jgi:hypothetical protein